MSSKKNISVLGAGKMGLGIAQLFATKGYNVKVIYVYDDKIRCDARAVVEDNLKVLAANDALDEAQIPEILGRIGFVDTIEEVADFADIVFECTGVPQMVQRGLDITQKSGTLVAVGIYPAKAELDLTAVVRSAKNIKGTYGGPVTLERLISWLDSANPLVEKLDKLITHKGPLKNADEAFKRCIRKENIKELFINFE